MNHITVLTSNVVRALNALENLLRRTDSDIEEGMGLLYGRPGEGKTTTIAYLVNRFDGIFLRANQTWTVTTMLQKLMVEMKLQPRSRRAPMIDAAIEELNRRRRPIFIDEADYLFRQADMLDALRDVYDETRAPVILIGMEEIARRIRTDERMSRFRRRITEWIEFAGLDIHDARKVAKEMCEVEIRDDLVNRAWTEVRGNIGEMVIAFSLAEEFAQTNRLASVGLAEYGNRSLGNNRELRKAS